MSVLIYMLVNDANGKHPVAPGVLYVIHKYDYKKTVYKKTINLSPFICPH